jgi:glutamate carboxypeptidase
MKASKTMESIDLEGFLQREMPSYLDLLSAWVGVNSHTANPPGVNEHGRQVADAFRSLGFEPEFVQAAEAGCGKHLFLSRRGTSKKGVVFVSHLDTVYSAQEEEDNNFRFAMDRDSDRIYGPGVGDIKGGTLMILMVLRTIAEVAPELLDRQNLMVALNAGEERLIPSFSCELRSRLPETPKALLVFEGGTIAQDKWPLVVARKGRFDFAIRVSGRSAHSGVDFWSGRNAVLAAADLVPRLHALSSKERDISVNVGRFAGGTEINRVPDSAYIEGEVRMFLDELEDYQKQIEDLVAACSLPALLDVPLVVPGWEENERTDCLFELWRFKGEELGMSISRQRRGGLSDGNYFWKDFPVIDGLGPTGANFHCSRHAPSSDQMPEFILRSSLIPKAVLNCLSLDSLLQCP